MSQRKQKLQLSMEESELRALRIPSTAHRGCLSPSKNSFLPTLQEQAQERSQGPTKSESRRRLAVSSEVKEKVSSKKQAASPQQQQLINEISANLLEGVKEDFMACDGDLSLEQFVKAMLRNLETRADDTKGPGRAVGFGDEGAVVPAASGKFTVAHRDKGAARAAAVIDLFNSVDVHGEGMITWDEVSNYLIEQGMAGGDEFTVDSIKTYEASPVLDLTKRDSPVEKLVYIEEIDALVCLTHNCRSFRLYEPKRCTVRKEVFGHRGTVVNCCYVGQLGQIATTGADLTICLWDAGHLGLRNRLSTKEVQLCVQWDAATQSLFSGSIDGTLSCWDISTVSMVDCKRVHKQAINDLLMVDDINLLASASSDGSILMWDTALMRIKKTFKGHKKGTFSLAYSMDYHCLLTAGLDQEALVWNPYVEKVPIFRLKGHTHALCGVSVVPGTPQIISADVEGTFRLWDMRNFRCVQSFGGNETHVTELNSFCTMPGHRRIAAGGSKIVLYDYMDEWGGDSVTDTGGVTDALYNPHSSEFYTLSRQSVKAWSGSSGGLFKVLKDISKDEITAACFSDNGRKLYVGNSKGKVTAHGLQNGRLLTRFESHEADISCLTIQQGTNRLFSASWDGSVKVHTDERSRPPQMKAEFRDHRQRDGVTCLTCSSELHLLASGGTDMQIFLYDLKTLKSEHSLTRFQHIIASIDFLASRCLMAVADQGGFVSLWRVRPHPDQWTCVYHFKNSPAPGPSLSGAGEGAGAPGIPVNALCFGKFRIGETAQAGLPAGAVHAAPREGLKELVSITVEGSKGSRFVHSLPTSAWVGEIMEKVSKEGGPPLSKQLLLYSGRVLAAGETLAEAGLKGEVKLHLLDDAVHRWPVLYTADAKGDVKCWDLSELCERRGIQDVDVKEMFNRLRAGVKTLAKPAAANFVPPGRLGRAGASPTPAVPAFPGTPASGAFITGLDPDADCERGSFVTTVRTSLAPPVQLQMREASFAPAVESPEVHILFEAHGHEEGITSMYVTHDPPGLITCGMDRRVTTWGVELERFGTLLQSLDPSFSFPVDLGASQKVKMEAAAEILRTLGPLEPRVKLPALTNGTRSPNETLLALGTGKKKGPKKKEPDSAWKLSIEQTFGDLDVNEEDIAFMEQLEAQGDLTLRALTDASTLQEPVLKPNFMKQNTQSLQRNTALSQEEATAAERLARAMVALGGEEGLIYAQMAKSIQPRLKSRTALEEDLGDRSKTRSR